MGKKADSVNVKCAVDIQEEGNVQRKVLTEEYVTFDGQVVSNSEELEFDMQGNWSPEVQAFRDLLIKDGLCTLAVNNAVSNYERFLAGESGLIPASEIRPVDKIVDYNDLTIYTEDGLSAISKVAVVNLNGGLGTGMGLSKAKSLLKVKDNLNFLDIIVAQTERARRTYRVPLPLLFMDSFSTDKDTLRALKGFKNEQELPVAFLQNKVRKIDARTKRPVKYEQDPSLEWCPPGHGDIFAALYQCGIIDRLIAFGYEYMFISNVDNLGATLDLNILGYLARSKTPFLMEVADRTEADKKGGHLAVRKSDGRLILRESAQCPEDEIESDFQNIQRYSYFNTNSVWFNLNSLNDVLLSNHGVVSLPLIVNHKTVNPRDKHSTPVIQLESAMGAAIALFDGTQAVRVPRSRFAPVKSTNDLIVVRSDRYTLSSESFLELTEGCRSGIKVSLGDHFKMIDDFEVRFANGIPSMTECDSFVIDKSSDFSFGKDIKLVGDVHLVNKTGKQIHIPDGTILKGEVIMG